MKPEDFAQMSWRIDLLDSATACYYKYQDLGKRFPDIDGDRVVASLTNDQLVRYIVFAYHKQSPFVQKITEVKHRKTQAFIQAGVDFKDGMSEDVKEIINNENINVADLILRFLLGENNMRFSALMMQMDAYYKQNYILAYGDVKSVKSIMEAINQLRDSIEALSHDVFSGDSELANFASGAASRGLVLTPEQFAHANKS